jgi:hypothetical protein
MMIIMMMMMMMLNESVLFALQGVLNPRRKEMVRLAFQQLDRDKSGTAELQEIKGKLNLV